MRSWQARRSRSVGRSPSRLKTKNSISHICSVFAKFGTEAVFSPQHLLHFNTKADVTSKTFAQRIYVSHSKSKKAASKLLLPDLTHMCWYC